MALVTYTDPVILDSTGQDIVTQLTRLANTQTYTAGDGINISNNVVSTKVASASQLGAIKVGDGLSIDGSTNELSVVVDSALSTTSENPVQNKVITNAINAISSMSFEVVQELPTTDIRTDVIYLVPKSTSQTNNTYDEYICLDTTTTPATWEKIGDTEIDLTNYVQKSQTAGLIKNDGTIDTTIGINVSTLNSNVSTLQSYMPSGVSAQNTLITEGTVNNRLATKVDASNLCFAQFSTSTSYYVGEYVRYNGTIYKCITDHPAGEWNSNHFDMAQTYRVMNEKNNTAPEFNVGLTLAVGDYCFRRNKLYRCTTAHFGQWDDSHFTEVKLGDEVKGKANTDDVENLHTVLDDTIGYECINFFSQMFENTTVGDLTLTRTLHLHDPRVYYVLTGTWSSPLGETATFDSPSLTLSAGNYKLSGCPSGGSLTTYTLNVCVANSSPRTTIATDTGDGVEFTLDADTEIILCIGIKNKSAGELTFTPMITRPFYDGDYVKNETNVLTKIKNITNGTTLDSFGDVETALASKANTSALADYYTRAEEELAGAKNFLPNEVVSGTQGDVTFTVNSNKTISTSGTATELIANKEIGSLKFLEGINRIVKLSGCPENGNYDTSYSMYIREKDTYNWVNYNGDNVIDIGEGAEFNPSLLTKDGNPISPSNVVACMRVANGTNMNGKVFSPMISFDGGAYVPFAKTNKQLTDDVATIPTVSVSHTGTASSTGVRKQQITVNNVSYDVDGSAYMEQSVTLSTSGTTTVTFTNAIIADGKMLTMASSIWDLVPDSMTTAVGSCTITLPKWTSAETVGVRLYVR